MLNSLLMGALAGQRALTPLTALAWAGREGRLPVDAPGMTLLTSPAGTAGATLLALAEMGGDKWRRAPDRIVASGMAARILTGGYAGAVLAAPAARRQGAIIGALTAVGAAFIGFGARMYWQQRFGQAATGLVEDGLVAGAAFSLASRPDR